MSVYLHEQGSYKSYRVARSVDGKLRQRYFARTEQGLKQAKAVDQEWANEQAQAQMNFSGMKARWRREPASAGSKTPSSTHTRRSTKIA